MQLPPDLAQEKGAIFVSSGYEPNDAQEHVEETFIIMPQCSWSKASTPRTPPAGVRASLRPKGSKSGAQAIRNMAKPDAEESELEVEVPEQALSLTQRNYQFNGLVGINPMQVEEMILHMISRYYV